MLTGRTYQAHGPFHLEPYGPREKATRFRVVDAAGRRLSIPAKRRAAASLRDLLNDAYLSGQRMALNTHRDQD